MAVRRKRGMKGGWTRGTKAVRGSKGVGGWTRGMKAVRGSKGVGGWTIVLEAESGSARKDKVND